MKRFAALALLCLVCLLCAPAAFAEQEDAIPREWEDVISDAPVTAQELMDLAPGEMAAAAGRLLAAGAQGPYAPEFMASLPITGEDGTMARRKVAVSWGRMKTGLLRDVRSIAGYVHAKSGKRYALYAGVNGKESLPGAQAFLDNVILWAYEH